MDASRLFPLIAESVGAVDSGEGKSVLKVVSVPLQIAHVSRSICRAVTETREVVWREGEREREREWV